MTQIINDNQQNQENNQNKNNQQNPVSLLTRIYLTCKKFIASFFTILILIINFQQIFQSIPTIQRYTQQISDENYNIDLKKQSKSFIALKLINQNGDQNSINYYDVYVLALYDKLDTLHNHLINLKYKVKLEPCKENQLNEEFQKEIQKFEEYLCLPSEMQLNQDNKENSEFKIVVQLKEEHQKYTQQKHIISRGIFEVNRFKSSMQMYIQDSTADQFNIDNPIQSRVQQFLIEFSVSFFTQQVLFETKHINLTDKGVLFFSDQNQQSYSIELSYTKQNFPSYNNFNNQDKQYQLYMVLTFQNKNTKDIINRQLKQEKVDTFISFISACITSFGIISYFIPSN